MKSEGNMQIKNRKKMWHLMHIQNVINFTTGDDLQRVSYFVVLCAHLTLDATNLSPQIEGQQVLVCKRITNIG